ncbi:MAG TPA: hypothetical protein VEZ72_00480, partial [Paenibacillus sp.]|nr:hypothetical protein [Paenibacillus sp.]
MLTLESRRLRIRFDRETGAVRELFDKKLRKEYALPLGADAFRLERSGGATSRFERCAHSISVSPEGETTIGFEWTVSDGLTVRGSAAASPRADDIRFVASVLNDAE